MAHTDKPKRTAVNISVDLHAEILKACPDGYKIQAFAESLIRAGLEQLRKRGKKK